VGDGKLIIIIIIISMTVSGINDRTRADGFCDDFA